jgi:hypothetical protein
MCCQWQSSWATDGSFCSFKLDCKPLDSKDCHSMFSLRVSAKVVSTPIRPVKKNPERSLATSQSYAPWMWLDVQSFLGSTGVWTQGHMFASQALCHQPLQQPSVCDMSVCISLIPQARITSGPQSSTHRFLKDSLEQMLAVTVNQKSDARENCL